MVRTRAVYNGLQFSDGAGFTNDFRGRVFAWRVPRKARREFRRQSVSGWEYLQAVSSYFTATGWSVRARSFWNWLWIDMPKSIEARRDSTRVGRYGTREDRAPSQQVPQNERDRWEVDIDGSTAPCWKGKRSIRQFTCEWENGELICEVEVRSGIPRPVRGLIRVSRAAFERLPSDRTARNAWLAGKFGKYVCRLRPDDRFVFNLRTWGPFLVNR
jgi:hypothetical protein